MENKGTNFEKEENKKDEEQEKKNI